MPSVHLGPIPIYGIAEIPASDELYNKSDDPYQLNNLMEHHPDVASKLYAELRDYMLRLRAS